MSTLKIPKKIPKNGFYYHYKHDPGLSVNNYAYEIVGIGHHTEEKVNFVIYRPLYEASVYKAGKMFDVRPLGMFLEKVIKKEKTIPRFKKITNKKILAQLEKIKREMYGLN